MFYPERRLVTTHIGSLPFTNLERALEYAFRFDIPAWPQLPKFKEEGMLWQFMKTFPGFDLDTEKVYTNSSSFEEEMLKIYEIYVATIDEGQEDLLDTLLDQNFSKTFFPFLEIAKEREKRILKGQITGPFTLGTAISTDLGEAIIFRDDLRDLLVKYLTLLSLAQTRYLSKIAEKTILFIDEPGLAGFGSSAYITLSKDLILEMLREMISILKSKGIITGIHICANTSWDIPLEAGIDIISFDSFSYFEKLLIYGEELEKFLRTESGYLAWGIVPTDSQHLSVLKDEELVEKFSSQLRDLSKRLAISEEEILKRSLLTPSCGMGSLNEDEVERVIQLLEKLRLVFFS